MEVLTLLADDYNLGRLKKRLALSGYHVMQMTSEADAWEYLQREPVQIVVLDCQLATSAYLEKIRQLECEEYVYIFALVSSDAEIDSRDTNGRIAYIDEYIIKPVEPDELIARLAVVDRYIKTLSAIRVKENRQEPIRDRVTGTFTQSTILELLATEISRSKRSRKPFALALLSLDEMDALEDRFNAEVVDRALVQVALKIWASVRSYDLIGRWGKTGFILLLPETSLTGASVVADRIRKNVNSVPLQLPDQSQMTLSASMGFVQSSQEQLTTVENLITSAENALARASEVGGNHIVFAWEA